MKIIFTLAILAVSISLFFSASNGVTSVQSVDRTGSPFSTSGCNQCHSGGAGTTTIETFLKDSQGNTVTEYEPGASYIYEIVLQNSSLTHFSFQSVALLNSDDSNAGTLTAGTANTKTATLSGRTYGDHNGVTTSNVFEMNWEAPQAGSGDVTFYAIGNAVNNNGGTSGDAPSGNTSLTINEVQPSSVNEEWVVNTTIYPNPVEKTLYISSNNDSDFEVKIYNTTGQLIHNNQKVHNNTQIDVEDWNSGTYFIMIGVDGKKKINKLIKK